MAASQSGSGRAPLEARGGKPRLHSIGDASGPGRFAHRCFSGEWRPHSPFKAFCQPGASTLSVRHGVSPRAVRPFCIRGYLRAVRRPQPWSRPVFFVGPAGAQQGLAGLEDEISAMLVEWGVPGLAAAVVQHDEVTFARGFGEREVGSGDLIDEHTIFAVGSTSKAFTAAAVAMLADEGKVAWG